MTPSCNRCSISRGLKQRQTPRSSQYSLRIQILSTSSLSSWNWVHSKITTARSCWPRSERAVRSWAEMQRTIRWLVKAVGLYSLQLLNEFCIEAHVYCNWISNQWVCRYYPAASAVGALAHAMACTSMKSMVCPIVEGIWQSYVCDNRKPNRKYAVTALLHLWWVPSAHAMACNGKSQVYNTWRPWIWKWGHFILHSVHAFDLGMSVKGSTDKQVLSESVKKRFIRMVLICFRI